MRKPSGGNKNESQHQGERRGIYFQLCYGYQYTDRFQLLLLTTPLGMVLQYFGSDQAVFSFNRNPTTFVLATIVLMLLLRVLALLFEYADVLVRLVYVKSSSRAKAPRPPVANEGES